MIGMSSEGIFHDYRSLHVCFVVLVLVYSVEDIVGKQILWLCLCLLYMYKNEFIFSCLEYQKYCVWSIRLSVIEKVGL